MIVDRVIVLGAGQGYQLDGFNKLLIKDPVSGRRIIDKYIEAFSGKKLTVVVGYRAINVMHNYPDLDYVYNSDWAVTNNSYSLSLALTEEPCYVISGDLLIGSELVYDLDSAGANLIVGKVRENRTLSAINVCANTEGRVSEVYQGKLRQVSDPEAIGIFKISSPELLSLWKRNCREHGNLFVGQNLPYDLETPVYMFNSDRHSVEEVNTPLDYLRLLEGAKNEAAKP